MLVLSVLMSLILFFITLDAFCRSANPVSRTMSFCLAFTLVPIVFTGVFPPVALQAVLLVAAVIVGTVAGWRPGRFALVACAASLASYAATGWLALQDMQRLRQLFPYTSMDDRLPDRSGLAVAGPLAEAAAQRLDHLEALVENLDPMEHMQRRRLRNLEQLHEHTVQTFVNRPAFGVMRMQGLSVWNLRGGLRQEASVPQPGKPIALLWSSGDLEPSATPAGLDRHWPLHQDSVVDFVNPLGFGYIKDRRHVAGFQAHQFSRLPAVPDEHWKLRTVDLIGVEVRPDPTAYVTSNLPRMDELGAAPQRPLDEFESVGLQALRQGQDHFVAEKAEGRRLLGAIRSTKQCLACHAGERGRLLGAFSYSLVREGG